MLILILNSEKLALGLALALAPPSEVIRLVKNLRICPDCHNAMKVISKITDRAIKARDANRMHIFKDGVCSCNDHW